CMQGTQLWTF
nr:immunoglobulin light chain junction region [Macaca mulatta]MOW07887.1 immunoglobulin light chain junction region [Macaca mulatta]MOW07888.1 immunoglobulin light chain junction region [Macaca mulatta]MOW07891.1 immunoglobulin light chain junction region [Macaca mulatta]MOW07899.1 immunoglobulin light chain junction region [Macaca mulatta]